MKAISFSTLTKWALPGCLIIMLVTGCQTRSISDSGYRSGRYGGSRLYHGELSEFDVLGIQRGKPVTDEEIGAALNSASPVRLRKGAAVLLIQSGAMIPDDPMVSELNRSFNIVPFSGVPERDNRPDQSYDRALRLAAAKGGCEYMVCYWGLLESAEEPLPGKAVSWLPIYGGVVPDQAQMMRIRLKMAIVDVRTGNWSMFMPTAFEDRAISGRYRREKSDQDQVQKLKMMGYLTAADDLLKQHAN